jgi:hypothetical protein
VVGFRFSGRLTQGPAVRATDRRHPLRLDMLTSTRSAYVQVRCAVVALWSGHHRRYAQRIRPASTKLDSFLPTSSDIAWLGPNLLSATGGCWNDKASLNGGELSAKLGPATPVRAPGDLPTPLVRALTADRVTRFVGDDPGDDLPCGPAGVLTTCRTTGDPLCPCQIRGAPQGLIVASSRHEAMVGAVLLTLAQGRCGGQSIRQPCQRGA